MKSPYWLLPFTCEGDMYAIDSVMRLAQSVEAKLILVKLLSRESASLRQGVPLDSPQRPQDFMEALRDQAARFQVPVQCYEVITVDVLHNITMLAHETQCSGIMLVIDRGKSRLLQDDELRHLLSNPPASLVLLRLPMRTEAPAVPAGFVTICLRQMASTNVEF